MKQSDEFQIHDRVKFTYQGDEPFTGQEMTGEILAYDPNIDMWMVWRDEQWRIADAVATWVKAEDMEKIS